MEKQFEGTDPYLSVLIAERISGVDSVAHALAYAAAIEDAGDWEVPARAQWLRVVVAELERIYNHLHYLGHLCHTTTLKVGEAEGRLLEERAKQINARATGSRFLRGIVCPGGIRRDIDTGAIREGLPSLATAFEHYVELLMRTTSHIDRLISTAPLSQELAFDQGATGPIERASGLNRDLRRDHPYAAYDHLVTNVASYSEGDAFARMKVRIDEVRASFTLIDEAIRQAPTGGALRFAETLPPGTSGLGWVEATRGTLLYAVHIDGSGRLGRVKIKSPSFSNWSVFPFTVHDSNMMDYAINEASFGLTIAGCAR
jgi:Ni,Fe-hydrogenase III large subunit